MRLQEPLDAKISKSKIDLLSDYQSNPALEWVISHILALSSWNWKNVGLDSEPSDGRPRQELVSDQVSGRVRRRAVFNDDLDEKVDLEEDDDEGGDDTEKDDEEDNIDSDDDGESHAEDSEEENNPEPIVLRSLSKNDDDLQEKLTFEGSDEEDVVPEVPSVGWDSLTPTAKLKKQLVEFLGVEENEEEEEMETKIEGKIDGNDGQFMRNGVVYDLNDAIGSESGPDEEKFPWPEDETGVVKPLKKKRKVSPVQTDMASGVHMKVKSMLTLLEMQTQSKKITEEDGVCPEDSITETDLDIDLKWKENLAQKASEAFYLRHTAKGRLRKLVYGDENSSKRRDPDDGSDDDRSDNDGSGQLGGLFKVVSEKKRRCQSSHSVKDQLDSSKFQVEKLQDWKMDKILDCIRDCFVTGKWKGNEDAEELLALDDMDDEGDFEDLETGRVHQAKKEHLTNEEAQAPVDPANFEDPEESRKKIWERKKKLKEQFNAEYDEGDSKGRSYYDDLKQEMDQQAQMNKSEFEGIEDELRVQYEGFRPGMYVRMEIEDMASELVTNFNPLYPLIVGALLTGEENIGFVQVFNECDIHFIAISNLDIGILTICRLVWRNIDGSVVYWRRETPWSCQ